MIKEMLFYTDPLKRHGDEKKQQHEIGGKMTFQCFCVFVTFQNNICIHPQKALKYIFFSHLILFPSEKMC